MTRLICVLAVDEGLVGGCGLLDFFDLFFFLLSGLLSANPGQYAFRAAVVSSVRAYLLFCHLSINPVAAFLFLSLLETIADCDAVSQTISLGDLSVIWFQACGPQLLPISCLNPAPIHLCSQDPLCDQLMTFPPLNFVLIFIQLSAKLMVTLPAVAQSCQSVDL